jgi:aminopeptidase N
MTSAATITTVYLKDYTVPAFLIPKVELDISLFEHHAIVRAKLAVERNSEATQPTAALQLNVDELTLESVLLNGIALASDHYTLDERYLTILKVSNAFELATACRIYPKQNTKLMGIYASSTRNHRSAKRGLRRF